MQTANDQFKQLMKIVATNYNKKLTADQLELFKVMAKQHGFNKFYSAMIAHMNDPDAGFFFPTMAHVSKQIHGNTKELEAESEGIAQIQWSQVMKAIKECGSYRTPTFKDPITTACVSTAGGWVSLCQKTTDQLIWVGKEFVSQYQNTMGKPLDQLPNKLSGRENNLVEQSAASLMLEKLSEGKPQ